MVTVWLEGEEVRGKGRVEILFSNRVELRRDVPNDPWVTQQHPVDNFKGELGKDICITVGVVEELKVGVEEGVEWVRIAGQVAEKVWVFGFPRD